MAAEEQYDILNQDGTKTGQVLSKFVVHEKELLHGSVFIWIYNNRGEVLVQLTIQQSELNAVKLLSIKDVQAERQKSNSDKVFAARNPRIYDTAFEAIEKILS